MSERLSIDRLHADPENANKGSARGREALKASLTAYGAGRSILVDKHDSVIAGNKTLEACYEMGIDEVLVVDAEPHQLVAVRRADLDLADPGGPARGLAYADNRVGQLSLTWDAEQLQRDIERGLLIPEIVFSPEEIQKLVMNSQLTRQELREPPVVSDAPERCEPGQLWKLGEHRLLCGDATAREDVERLLAGEAPGLMVTDPPYGVQMDPTWRARALDRADRRLGGFGKDECSDWTAAWRLFPGDVAYVWHASLQTLAAWSALEATPFEVRAQILWKKQHFVLGRGHYHWQHEPCLYAVRQGKSAQWIGLPGESTVWDINNALRQGGGRDGGDWDDDQGHGAQKPIECMARPIRNHAHGLVYDPFLGSGTTLMAAEQLSRRCLGLEIQPRYCDTILERYLTLTGVDPERLE